MIERVRPERQSRAARPDRARRRAGPALAALLVACGGSAPSAASSRLPAAVTCARIVRIDVRKDERALVAHCDGGATVALSAAFGREPLGAKRRLGDLRTPEGLYHVAQAGRASRFHRFIPLDYPSRADADAALAVGALSIADHRRVHEAHARGELPPSDTPLGGAIGIHGEGDGWRGFSRRLDWTEGCIALSDEDVDFLAARVAPGTPVWITPSTSTPASGTPAGGPR
jgi:murein L,D-transpeptidase YafK